jgi:hypothetical protein
MKRPISLTCLALILLTGAVPGFTADIGIHGAGELSLARIDGPIEAGDFERFRSAVMGAEKFPDNLNLDFAAGDVTESMRIGRFAREAMLSVSAGRKCSGVCFLTWTGGTIRNARRPMDIRVTVDDPSQADEIRAYLAEMNVPPEFVEQVFDADAEPIAPDALLSAIGRRDQDYEAWLIEKCGAMTAEHDRDRRAIEALIALESAMARMGMGGGSTYALDPETQSEAARAGGLSEEYRKQVTGAYARLQACRTQAVAEARAVLD